MRWEGFQDSAERLAQGTAEGDWRSAISRGYYAVFHFFRDTFLAHGLDVGRGGQSHFNLYSGRLNCGYPAIAAIASRIDALRAHRVLADYDLSRSISQRAAHGSSVESRAIVADFQALANIRPDQVVAGARQHLLSTGRLGRQP